MYKITYVNDKQEVKNAYFQSLKVIFDFLKDHDELLKGRYVKIEFVEEWYT